MTEPRTLFQKLWDAHAIVDRDDGQTLLHVDLHFAHEGSFHAFNTLADKGLTVRRPDRTIGVADHYVPTLSRDMASVENPEIREIYARFVANMAAHGIKAYGVDDPGQGIVHVIGPEQGLSQPGMLIVCGDSHTATHGALGAFAFGIGASEVAHVLATQTLWQVKPKSMRITLEGARPPGVTGKDMILHIIARIGAVGGTGHVIEYAGDAIRDLSIEERLTVCNMSIEAGARAGMIAPDAKTEAYLAGRPAAPRNDDWAAALAHWRSLPSDPGACYDAEVVIDAAEIAPTVTWGTSPEDAIAITGRVPDPADAPDAERARALAATLDYMGLTAGQAIAGTPVDKVFIGSCTNSRLEDLRAAAAIVRGRQARVPAIVSPGSTAVKRAAEAEGLDRVFLDAGFEWRESGCSLCVAVNGDLAAPGERLASTTNRNFRGRQGPGARTHLVSPAMAAAAAVTGCLTDLRELSGETAP